MEKDQIMKLKFIAAKALGFINAISNLSREERQHRPSGKFGRDYNQLLQVVKEECPQLDTLLPPEVTLTKYSDGDEYCEQLHGEVYAFCEQIYQMVNSITEDEEH